MSHLAASSRGMRFAEFGDEPNFLRFRLVLQIRQPHAGVLMQNGPEVAQVEKLLREQVGAVAFDECDERIPFVVGGKPLDDAQPQACDCGRASG